MKDCFWPALATSLAIAWAAAQAAPPAESTITTVAGTGHKEAGPASGAAATTNIGEPFGVELGPNGALYICETSHHRLRRLNLATGKIDTVAGCGEKGYSGDGGPATAARLNEPYEVRFDGAGNIFFVERLNHLVRRVDAQSGIITTVAGNGSPGFGGDGGPGPQAQLNEPHSIALDGAGGLYIADIKNHRVRRLNLATGRLETWAGNGEKKLPHSGAAIANSPVLGPRALFFTPGTLWIALREGHSVWRVNLNQRTWQHVAGTGARGYTGDSGPAAQATFDGPKGLAVDEAGNVFVVDTENHAVRHIAAATGLITTLAGRGPKQGGYGGDGGPAPQAQLFRPHSIGLGPEGVFYIGDSSNHRVRRVGPAAKLP